MRFLYALLVFVPIAIAGRLLHWPPIAVFMGLLTSGYAFLLLYSLRTHTSAFLAGEAVAEVTVAPHWSSKQALTILVGSAVAIGVVSEILVSVPEEAVMVMGLSL